MSQATIPLAPAQQEVFLRPALASLNLGRAGWACLALCTAVFTGWSFLAAGSASVREVLFFLALPLAACYLGRVVLTLVGAADEAADFPLVFLTGSVTAAFLLFCLQVVGLLPLWIHCLLLFAASALAQPFVQRRSATPLGENREAATGVLVVLLGLAAATAWSQDVLRPVRTTPDVVVFLPWQDYFVHASLSARFLAERSILSLGNYSASGEPAPFYHYCSYVLPASLSAFTGQTGYQAVTGFWTPFGVFLTGLGAYALAASWWGARAGALALVGFLLLPDASSFGLAHPFLGYHRVQQVVPGGLYGVATGALALWCVTRGIRRKQAACVALGLAFALGSVVMKAHVFLVVLPVVALWVVLASPFAARRKVALAVGCVAAGLLALYAGDYFHVGPPLKPDGSGLRTYLKVVSLGAPPYLEGRLAELRTDSPTMRIWLLRVGFILTITLSAYAIAYPLMLFLLWNRWQLQPEDAIPALSIAAYLFCVFGLPRSDYTSTPIELQHRPFVWVYFIVSVWTWGRLFTLVEKASAGGSFPRPAFVVPVCLLLLVFPFSLGANIADGFPASDGFTRLHVPAGLVDCAAFVRSHTAKTDVVQYSSDDENYTVFGLTERRAYLCCSPGNQPIPERYMPLVQRRRAAIERLKQASTSAGLAEWARRTGIRWYLMRPDDRVAWPGEYLSQPVFSSNGFRVYDLREAGPEPQDDLCAERPKS